MPLPSSLGSPKVPPWKYVHTFGVLLDLILMLENLGVTLGFTAYTLVKITLRWYCVLQAATRAVELAKVLGIKAFNRHRTSTIVLDDLVLGIASTTADDLGHVGGRATLDGKRIFAHIIPPHILDRAVVAFTVNLLRLLLADDDILERGTRFNQEVSSVFATFGLTSSRLFRVNMLA
ncbi:hypothetical protein Ae201684P_019452 [Aphanomyces euteiches]|nr:hypothetical protein Ae201684P_019452 [Aphanomyces euteiches]